MALNTVVPGLGTLVTVGKAAFKFHQLTWLSVRKNKVDVVDLTWVPADGGACWVGGVDTDSL